MAIDPKQFFKKAFPLKELLEVKDVLEAFKKKDAFLSKLTTKVEGKIDSDSHWFGKIFVGGGTIVKHGVTIEGPVWIGKNCRIGPGTHIRPGTVIGDSCELGKIEVKNSILMNGVHAHHHGYIGDSIIGDSVNIAAGVVTANFKFDGSEIKLESKGSGMRKLGSIIGDSASIGSNATLMPGTVVGPRSWIYPGSVVRGTVPADKILKNKPGTEIADKK
jgi:bifunctional UDP-N-acetylglucosamine pyrophosphorylase/glucosamine-1-phosphate N-acetyltransferase